MRIEILGGIFVVTNFIQTLGIIIKGVDPFRFEVVMLCQILLESFGIS